MKKILFASFLFLVGCQESPIQNDITNGVTQSKMIMTGDTGFTYKAPDGISFKESLPFIKDARKTTMRITNQIKNKNWEEASEIVEDAVSKENTLSKHWVEATLSGYMILNKFQKIQSPNDKYYEKLSLFTKNLIDAGSPSVQLITPILEQLDGHISSKSVADLANKTIQNVKIADINCKLTCAENMPNAKLGNAQKEIFIAELKGISSRSSQ